MAVKETPLEYDCPLCRGRFAVPAASAGSAVRCPHCQGAVALGVPTGPAQAGAPPAPARKAPSSGRPPLTRGCPQCGQRTPVERSRCDACGTFFTVAAEAHEREAQGDPWRGYAPERAAFNLGVVGGLILIGIAAVWFFVGWQMGYIFFYPPILALLGVVALIKGAAEGNLAGKRAAPRRRRR